MQFLNPSRRIDYLHNIYNGLNDGGCLILTEKIYQQDGKIQEIFTFSHYDYKLKSFDSNEILQKEKDLRFIMKPNDLNELRLLLENVGFKTITPFWQMFNFIGLLCTK
jgi:tRNA (cmo5U34)-methyltransferase